MRDLGSRTIRFSLFHAIDSVVPSSWSSVERAGPYDPDPLELLRETDEMKGEVAIDPVLALALLDVVGPMGEPPPLIEELMARHPRARAAEVLAERLEEAGRRRGPTETGLVIRPHGSDLWSEGEGWIEPSSDLELTMLVMSKSSDHLYLAARRPVLHRIRTAWVFDLVILSRRAFA